MRPRLEVRTGGAADVERLTSNGVKLLGEYLALMGEKRTKKLDILLTFRGQGGFC